MSYKWSIYNVVVESGNEIIWVNTMYFNTFKVKNGTELSRQLADKNIETLSNKVVEYLKNNNFLVDESMDEKKYCDFYRNCSVYSDSFMNITIIPTDACNFRCVYCYENSENKFMSTESENAILKYLQKNIHKLSHLRVSWFGGEPLVRKDQVLRMTRKINEMCKKHGVQFCGDMTTNAYELDLDTFNELVQNRIFSYQICIDGNEVSHNKQRPHFKNSDSYRRILNNIKDIKEKCKSNTFLITLRSNIAQETEQYLDSYLREIHSIIGDDKRFEIIFQGVRDWGGKRLHSNKVNLLEQEDSIYEKWFVKAAKLGLNSAEKLRLSIESSICEGNYANSFIVYPDCSIHKCTMAYYNKDTKSAGEIGRISSDGRLHIDDIKVMNWMSRANNQLQKCTDCKLYPICKGGACPYYTNLLNKTMDTSDHCKCLESMLMSKIKCMDIKKMIPMLNEEIE